MEWSTKPDDPISHPFHGQSGKCSRLLWTSLEDEGSWYYCNKPRKAHAEVPAAPSSGYAVAETFEPPPASCTPDCKHLRLLHRIRKALDVALGPEGSGV